MMVTRQRSWLLAGLVLSLLAAGLTQRALAAAAPGPITNTASATYQDGGGNTYTTTSNTITTYVQNAPGITVTPNAGQKVAPGQTGVADTFTIQNTGNGSGIITLPTSGGSVTSIANGTIGSGPTSSATCGAGPSEYAVTISGVTTYCDKVTDLNTFLATQPIAAGVSITAVVYYTVSAAAAPGSTAGATITPTISQAAQTGVAAASATSPAATVTDTVVEPRIDTYKTASLSGANILYTIYAHNGGNGDAKDLSAVKALLGTAVTGVLISDQVPVVGGTPLTITNAGVVSVTTTVANGFPAGSTVDVYYTTATSGTSGWTKATGAYPTYTVATNSAFLAMFIHGGTCAAAGYDLCSDTGHVTSPGNANVATTPAIQFGFQVQQPAGGLTATNLANSIVGDNGGFVIAPGVPGQTPDGGAGVISGGTSGINNTTLTSTSTGASNQTSTTITATDAPLNGPLSNPAATGSYDFIGGTGVSNDNMHDFTAIPFEATGDTPTNSNTTYQTNNLGAGAGAPTSSTTTSAGVTLCIGHTVQNNGNRNDTYTLALNATSGGNPITAFAAFANSGGATVTGAWTVGFYSDSLCTAAYGGSTQGATTTASTGALTAGTSVNYYTKYVIPAGTTYFNRYDATITATSGNTPATNNTTHDELYAAFVAMAKKITSVTHVGLASCTATGSLQVCPGDTINYAIQYANLTIGTTTGALIPVSLAQCETKAGTFLITDDGTAGGNTWAANTNGLTAAPVDTNSAAATRASTTYTYTPGPGALAATKFIATLGGASFQLVPIAVGLGASTDISGAITFSVIVK
ncbi:MAG: beta strand repeat-containing protein [Vulcanimicrobiaceae bacterium]